MRPSVRLLQSYVYYKFDGEELLITSDGQQDQQNIVLVIDHTLVEQGKQLNKCSDFCTQLCLKAAVSSDPVAIS